MKRLLKPLTSIALFAAVIAGPAGATDLKSAYQAALTYDADLQAARFAQQEAQESVPNARAALLPQLNYSLGRNQVNTLTHYLKAGVSPDIHTGPYWSKSESLVLRQAVFRKPAWDAFKAAIAQAEAADATLRKEFQDVAMRVASNYLETLSARERLTLAKNETVSMEAWLALAEKSFKAGRGTRTDIEDARSRWDLAKAKQMDAEFALATAYRNLEVVAGINPKTIPELNPQRLNPELLLLRRKDEWLQRIEDVNPDIQALRKQLEAAQRTTAQAEGGHLPTLDLVAAHQYSRSDTNYTVGVAYNTDYFGFQLNVPLYSGGSVMAQARAAQAREERVRQGIESTRRKTLAEATRLFLAVEQGQEQVHALRQAVISAEQAVIGDKKGIQAGTRIIVDVLDSERRMYQAMSDYSFAVYSLANNHLKFLALADAVDTEAIEKVSAWLSSAKRVPGADDEPAVSPVAPVAVQTSTQR